eukprot:jgi/Ulvmu1/2758/UM014_0216.1
MSQVYNLEPPTKGQVVLRTTYGDIEVELWPKEAPKAVRNFTQLCMEGYYDNSIFHRVIKDFMIQGGDPSGTGSGGESIYGKKFKNEFHSRLKFCHRGLVACANEAGKADSNSSQFFITTERCDHLDRQNTIFGRVSGDTIFTVLRMQEVEVDDHDRPVDPPTITSCEVLLPPFDDIVPRTTPEERRAKAAAVNEAKRLADVCERKQHGKRLNVLSFGDDAQEDQEDERDAANVRFRSAHETLQGDSVLEAAAVGVHDDHVAHLQERMAAEKKAQAARDKAAATTAAVGMTDASRTGDIDDEADMFAEAMRAKVQARSGTSSRAVPALAHMAAEQAPRQNEEHGTINMGHGQQSNIVGISDRNLAAHEASTFLSDHKKMVAQYKKQKLCREDREADTLSKMKIFKSKLRHARSGVEDAHATAPHAAAPHLTVAYDGKVNTTIDHKSYMPASWRIDNYLDESDDDAVETLVALATRRVLWDANDGVADPTTRNESVDDYKVVDPLLEAGKAAFNLKTQKAKKRGNQWAGRANM